MHVSMDHWNARHNYYTLPTWLFLVDYNLSLDMLETMHLVRKLLEHLEC